jgi:hypothetical protein
VLWPGYHNGLDLARLDRRIVGALALPLKHGASEGNLIAAASKFDFGLALPGQARLNQLPPTHPARKGAFQELPYAAKRVLDPDSEEFSARMIATYAELHLDAALAAGATLATTPGHLPATELGLAREQDLALAEATVSEWNARQAWRPPPQTPNAPSRELFASIVVRAVNLPAAVDELIELYSALDVAGHWIEVIDCGQSAIQLAAVTDLALGLQEATERPSVVFGVVGIHQALLASGVAATCAGYQGMSPTFPPALPPETDDENGIGVQVFHPAILGVIALGERYDAVREELFAAAPCRCGEHTPNEPPRKKMHTIRHNAWTLQQEAWEAISFPPVIAEARMLARVERANKERRRLGLRALKPGWHAVAPVAQARRNGGAAARDA